MELPRKFLVSVFTVAAAASVVGVARYDNYKPPLSKQQTAVTQTVQQTVPIQQAPIQQAVTVKAPETTSEKQAKLAAMEASDQFMLAADGYKATARLDYGSCNGGPPTGLVDPGLHYHGTSTCIEYAAVVTSGANAGQHVHIYVQHRGVSGDPTDTEFTSLKGPACRRTKPTRRKPVKTWIPLTLSQTDRISSPICRRLPTTTSWTWVGKRAF